MTLLNTVLFGVISLLYLFNISGCIAVSIGKIHYRKLSYFLLVFYFISGILCSWYIDGSRPVIYLSATICFNIFLFLWVAVNNKGRAITSMYVTAAFLSVDSILQSLGCILVELFVKDFDRVLVLNVSSLIFNAAVLIILKIIHKDHKYQIRSSIKLLPKRLYVLILITLVIIGELCGNMSVESSELYFNNNINSFLTVMTIVIFLIIIISFVFSSISSQYYESISKIMEKQVINQVEHYKKINKLTEDLREIRHDYKNHMLCLQATLEKRQTDEALDYIKSITKQDIIESNRFSSGNEIADSILSEKNESAENKGSRLKFSGFISDEISAVDLCTILSNALDNSIEACAKINAGQIPVIEVKCAIVRNIQIIKISNPNSDNGNSTETSKEDKENHGLGLPNIRRTVEKLGGEMKIPETFPEFVLELEFPIKY